MNLKTIKEEEQECFFVGSPNAPSLAGSTEALMGLRDELQEKLYVDLKSAGISIIAKCGDRAYLTIESTQNEPYTSFALGFKDFDKRYETYEYLKDDIIKFCFRVKNPIVIFREHLLVDQNKFGFWRYYLRLLALEGR